MPAQAEPPIAVNEPLVESYRLEPITFDLVCRRMAMGREALEKQVVPAALNRMPADTHVTPTDRIGSASERIASAAPAGDPGRDIGMIARAELIAQLETSRNRLLYESKSWRPGGHRRVQIELAASVFHFRLYDVLIGGDGTDRRSREEIAWERRFREATTPSAIEWVTDRKISDETSRMRPLFEMQISYDEWEEIY